MISTDDGVVLLLYRGELCMLLSLLLLSSLLLLLVCCSIGGKLCRGRVQCPLGNKRGKVERKLARVVAGCCSCLGKNWQGLLLVGAWQCCLARGKL